MTGPQIRALVLALHGARVEWILTGSVAVLAWHGAPWPFEPGDLDVVPQRSPQNLERLARLLESLHAKPIHVPEWKRTLSPEECAAWTPWPAEETRLDHLLETNLGRLDVVPRVTIPFEELAPRIHPFEAWGVRIRVADPADLAATMRPDQPKHAARASIMATIAARRCAGLPPAGFDPA